MAVQQNSLSQMVHLQTDSLEKLSGPIEAFVPICQEWTFTQQTNSTTDIFTAAIVLENVLPF